MNKKERKKLLENLPPCAADFIKLVIKKMRYRKKIRADVMTELTAHFEDELKNYQDPQQRNEHAQKLIEQFGDAKLLGVLLRRAKKRCRPLWRKCLIQTSKVIGFVVLYILIRVIFLTVGTPTISVNYSEWLNELSSKGRNQQQNAFSYYKQASEIVVPITDKVDIKAWPGDLNDIDLETALQWLQKNQKAIESVRKGALKSDHWPVYKVIDDFNFLQEDLMDDLLPDLSKYRSLARLINWSILYKASIGDFDAAIDNCLVFEKFAMHPQGKGLLIEQLVAISIEALAHNCLYKIIENIDLPADSLRKIQANLENNFKNQLVVIGLEAEKALWYDLVQRNFTDDGRGNGRPIRKGVPLIAKDVKNSLIDFFFCRLDNRRQFVNAIDSYFKQMTETLNTNPYQLKDVDINSKLKTDYFMFNLLIPAHSRINKLVWRVKTGRSGLLTVVAVLLHQKERGYYSTNLDELISSGCLKSLPMDPYSDKPLIYKKTDDGFILYSVGLNFTDDGGEVVRDDEGKVQKWSDKGDWVFWPLNK